MWLGVGVFWLFGVVTVKRTERTQSLSSRLIQISLEILAFFLLFSDVWPDWLRSRLPGMPWLGLALTALGIGFAAWARLWLGSNWSGRVTVKEHHELIQSGPYAIVRHPIYSGFLLAILGTALVHGVLTGFLALPVAALGWALKLRTEEAFMIRQFSGAYLDYKRRVKALVPFVV